MQNLIVFMMPQTQPLSDLSLMPRIKSSTISMVALNMQQSALRLKLLDNSGELQMWLMLIMQLTLRLLSWIWLQTQFMMLGASSMLSLSTSIMQRVIFLKVKYSLWVWLKLLVLITWLMACLTKVDALYSWLMWTMELILTFTKSSSVLQMWKLS